MSVTRSCRTVSHIGRAGEDRHASVVLSQIEIHAIFDGHGGNEVSKYLKDALLYRILSGLNRAEIHDGSVVKKALLSIFQEVDADICNSPWRSGSTAIIAIITRHVVYLINLGDSRAVIYNDHHQIYIETLDHKPDHPTERARIVRAGGSVINTDCARVQGMLAISRAFGDVDLKRPVSLVSPVPDVYMLPIHEVRHSGLHLIMASDGLWDTLPSSEVVNHRDLNALLSYAKRNTDDDITITQISIL